MKLIVTDMDGTLLNSMREISKENAAALLAAQQKGVEIAIATGRTYASALGLCQRAGLNPYIISNHGAFVYTKTGKQILGTSIKEDHIKNAITWLADNKYFYSVCTDKCSYIPANMEDIFMNDYKTARNLIPEITEETVHQRINLYWSMDDRTMLHQMDELFDRDLTFGSVVAVTFDRDKLIKGREHFSVYPDLTMTVAGRDIFEMIDPLVSKGNALEHLIRHLKIPIDEVMAIGDNYNDLSMLEKAGISVAIGNAEEEVKKVCKYVSLSNDLNGVAYMINKMLS